MTRLNKNSDLYYLNKLIGFKPLNLAKVHFIDDDCNEFIATVKGFSHMLGYTSPKEITVIDYEPYTEEKWNDMMFYIEYERGIVL